LPSDVTELLDTYLDLVPTARRQADVMARTVGTARETVRRFPELARGTEVQSPSNVVPIAQWLPWLARAAMVAAVAVFCSWLGYRAGINSIPVQSARMSEKSGGEMVGTMQANADKNTAEEPQTTVKGGHRTGDVWARYNVAFDRNRGSFTVAVQP
jgi:hypothetical protein